MKRSLLLLLSLAVGCFDLSRKEEECSDGALCDLPPCTLRVDTCHADLKCTAWARMAYDEERMCRALAPSTSVCVDRGVDCSDVRVAAREYEGGPVFLFAADPRCRPSKFIVDDTIETTDVVCKLEP